MCFVFVLLGLALFLVSCVCVSGLLLFRVVLGTVFFYGTRSDGITK